MAATPQAVTPYKLAPEAVLRDKLKPSTAEGAMYDGSVFTTGKWEVELEDWRKQYCVPNGWMVCCLQCVSLAQITVRIGAGSFHRTLWTHVALNVLVLAMLAAEVVLYYIYLESLHDDMQGNDVYGLLWGSGAVAVVILTSVVMAKMVARLRTRVRERFQIPGSDKDDDHAAFCCTPCAIGQMAIQVKSFTPGSCDFNAPEELPAYIP